MATFKEIARTFALGFSVGYFDKHDLITWADNIIATQPSRDSSIVDLSLCTQLHPLDVLNILDRVQGPETLGHAKELLVGLLARDLKNGSMDEHRLAFILNRIGDIPDDGHWPDMLENARGDEHTFRAIADRIRRHVMSFEPFADEWKQSVQQSA